MIVRGSNRAGVLLLEFSLTFFHRNDALMAISCFKINIRHHLRGLPFVLGGCFWTLLYTSETGITIVLQYIWTLYHLNTFFQQGCKILNFNSSIFQSELSLRRELRCSCSLLELLRFIREERGVVLMDNIRGRSRPLAYIQYNTNYTYILILKLI